MKNQFDGLDIECVPGSLCVTGSDYLTSLGMDYIPIYGCALVLIGLIGVMRVATWLVLRFRP